MVTPIAAAYFEDAERGDAAAQFHLGECYMEGIGVDVNSRIAVDWFKSPQIRASTWRGFR